MRSHAIKKPAPTRSWIRMGVAAAVVVLLVTLYLRQSAGDAHVAMPATTPSGTSERFGPGVFTQAPQPASPAPMASDTTPPDGLSITADQHLVINKALHDVIDYFLLGGFPGERATHVEQLLAHMKSVLPAPAYAEAAQIVQKYLVYLEEHDKLLARQATPPTDPGAGMASMDLDRIAAWIAQRARLRQSVLGIDVAQAWYGDEETEAQQKLAELRSRTPGSAASTPVDTDPLQQTAASLRDLRAKGASQDAQRAVIAQRFGEQAAQRFDVMEHEEQAWQERYATYRREADKISRQSGIAATDRASQIDALRAQTFSAEPERLRAQALDSQHR